MPIDLIDDGLIRFGHDEAPPSNSALDEWVEQQVARGREIPEPGKVRRAHGPCRLCSERPAQHVCVHCDRDVCREDFWTMLGVCRGCVTDEEVANARDAKPARPRGLGIKWVED